MLGCNRAYMIVDDGSTDDTGIILQRYNGVLPVSIITHGINLGLGPSLRDGLKAACEIATPNDLIFTMDADNTHSAHAMHKMVSMLEEEYDVVIASRYRSGSRIIGLSWYRKLLSIGAGILFRTVFPIHGVRDYTCGYRGYRASILQQAFEKFGDAFVEYNGFQCMADILLKLGSIQAKIIEVPLILRYDRKIGVSKMDIWCTVRNTLVMLYDRRTEVNRGRAVAGT